MLSTCMLALALAGPGKVEKIETSDKVTLATTWFAPKKRKVADAPAMILVPMYKNRRQSYDAFATVASAKGIGCLAIDPRGHGESQNPYDRPVEQWSGREWGAVLTDIKAAKAHLVAKGVNSKRIVIVGASIGASLALEYAVTDAEIAGVGFLSISTDLTGQGPAKDLARMEKRPVFVAYSTDDTGSVERGAGFAKAATAAGSGTVRVYKRAGHGTSMFGREDTKGDLTLSLIAWAAKVTTPAEEKAKGDDKAKRRTARRSATSR